MAEADDVADGVGWHVYGLLYRSDKNYEEATKCYRFAIKYDNENIHVLRDYAFLQIQTRDYEGFNVWILVKIHVFIGQSARVAEIEVESAHPLDRLGHLLPFVGKVRDCYECFGSV